MGATIQARNLAAEARAVETGHRAIVQPGGWVKVKSDTHGDLAKFYRVEFQDHGAGIRFTCRPEGPRAYADDHLQAASSEPGQVPCWHAALAARRLEREGLAVLDPEGRWITDPRLLESGPARLTEAESIEARRLLDAM